MVIDYDIYPDERQIDFGQDLETLLSTQGEVTPRCRVDIKASKSYSKWLMVEGHKFWSDAYILIKINLTYDVINALLESRYTASISGEVSGFAYYFDLVDPKTKSPWFLFRNGEHFFDPATLVHLPKGLIDSPKDLEKWLEERAKNNLIKKLNVSQISKINYGFPADWLRNSNDEWESFFEWIKNSTFPGEDQIIISRLT